MSNDIIIPGFDGSKKFNNEVKVETDSSVKRYIVNSTGELNLDLTEISSMQFIEFASGSANLNLTLGANTNLVDRKIHLITISNKVNSVGQTVTFGPSMKPAADEIIVDKKIPANSTVQLMCTVLNNLIRFQILPDRG